MLKRLSKIIILLLIWIFIFFVFNFFYSYKIVSEKRNYKHLQYKTIDKVPTKLKEFSLQIEDKRFYKHFWVDFLALVRAVKEDIKKWYFQQWASTIGQQSIKLNEKKFFNRWIWTKLREIFLAINLNFHYKKDDILLFWLNNIHFSYWIKGFKSACNIYFQRPCSKLFDSELLFLYALYQVGWWDVYKSDIKFQKVKKRSKILCKQLKLDFCEKINKLPPVKREDLKMNFKKLNFLDLVPDYVKNRLNIDTTYQEKIKNILKNTASFRKNKWFQDCCVMVMNKKWKIKAMQTCRNMDDFKNKTWINACLVKRQTWSAVKPFVYLLAMKKINWTWWTILEDKPVDFVLNSIRNYAPKNFDMKYHGKVSLAQALGSSLNIPAVTSLDKVGVNNFLSFINYLREKLWDQLKNIKKDKQIYNTEKLGLSAALWTYEMSVFEFTNLYRVFLNEHKFQDLAWWINEILKILSQNKNRLLSFGLENNLDIRWWSVKTWTSRNFVDGWTCGVNKEKQVVVCVWVWNLNSQSALVPGSEWAWFIWNLVVKLF